MQQGWKIFLHSLRMVFGNIGAALRVSLVPYLVQVAVSLYTFQKIGPAIRMMQTGQPVQLPPGFWSLWGLLLAVTVVTGLWIAVAWHRYVLVEEEPGALLPKFHSAEMVRYFWVSLLIALIMIMVGAAVMLVMMILMSVLGPSPFMALIGFLVTIIPLVYIFYRLSPALPAAAIGRKMSLADAWSATAPAGSAIFTIAILGALAGIIFEIPSMIDSNPGSIINLVYSHVTGWIVMMIGISVLTTIYGVYVEGREI